MIAAPWQQPGMPTPTVTRADDLAEGYARPLYAFDISLQGMSRTKGIDWSALGFSGDSLADIKRSGVRIGSVELFAQLTEAGKELSKARTETLKLAIRSSGRWVCSESQLPSIWSAFQEMQARANELRQQLQNNREQGLSDLRDRVTGFLGAPEFGLDSETVALRVASIIAQFPTAEQIGALLRVEWCNFVEIRPLREQFAEDIARDTNLIHLETQREDARNAREARRALAEIQARQREEIAQMWDESFAAAREEAFEIARADIASLRELLAGNKSRPTKTVNAVGNHLSRLLVLTEFDDGEASITAVRDRLSEIHATATRAKDGVQDAAARLRGQLDALRDDLDASRQRIAVVEAETRSLELVDAFDLDD